MNFDAFSVPFKTTLPLPTQHAISVEDYLDYVEHKSSELTLSGVQIILRNHIRSPKSGKIDYKVLSLSDGQQLPKIH